MKRQKVKGGEKVSVVDHVNKSSFRMTWKGADARLKIG